MFRSLENIVIHLLNSRRTWISLEFTLDKVIREGTKLFHPTNCNILPIDLFPLFSKLIIQLQTGENITSELLTKETERKKTTESRNEQGEK